MRAAAGSAPSLNARCRSRRPFGLCGCGGARDAAMAISTGCDTPRSCTPAAPPASFQGRTAQRSAPSKRGRRGVGATGAGECLSPHVAKPTIGGTGWALHALEAGAAMVSCSSAPGMVAGESASPACFSKLAAARHLPVFSENRAGRLIFDQHDRAVWRLADPKVSLMLRRSMAAFPTPVYPVLAAPTKPAAPWCFCRR
jgi:hypothetical protein